MHIDSFFACSDSIEKSEYVLFGIPYDATQSFKPGSRFAPTAIREASWNFEEFSVFFRRNAKPVFDAGNIRTDGSFQELMMDVDEFMKRIKDKIPIMLGGEHTTTYLVSRNFDSDIPFVIFDAHFDMRSEFDGNMYNHACTVRRIMEKHEVVLIGVRSCTKEELEFAESEGVKYYTSFECIKRWDEITRELEKNLPEKIYLSIDMDAFDPAYAPGVSTPEPFGIEPTTFLDFVSKFGSLVCGMDVVEVIPDAEKITPLLAAKFIIEFLCSSP